MTGRRQVFDPATGRFQLEEAVLPTQLNPGEVLVRIRLATVCGSDLHTLAGRRAAPGRCILGHEAAGEIVALGAGREALRVGDRVTWSLCDSCGSCVPCTEHALPQKCAHLFKYGHAALDAGGAWAGCFASHILLRAGTAVEVVPEQIPDAAAAPLNCAVATAMAACDGLPAPGRAALVLGGGLVGLAVAGVLRDRGWPRVAVSDPDPGRTTRARELGFAVPAAGERFDVVVEAAGHPAAVEAGLAAVRTGGWLVWTGLVHDQDRIELAASRIVKGCLTVRGVHNYAPRHLREAIAFLARAGATWPLADWVSPPVPLADLDQALALARSGRWLRVAVAP